MDSQARAPRSDKNRCLNHFVSSQALAQSLEFRKHFWNGEEFSGCEEQKAYAMRIEDGLKGVSAKPSKAEKACPML